MEVFDIFAQINQVPRPSKHEEKMCAWLIRFAEEHHLDYEFLPIAEGAKVGNIVMRKPATPGYENHPGVILQGHIDMVCEKNNDTEHDFFTDPIQTYIEDGWMHAKGTTLGADDGIGVAMALAVLTSNDAKHPALECLFTVDEETGLTGADCMPAGKLNGTRLINLDNEDDGQICMGCAGGVGTLGRFRYEEEAAPKDYFAAELKIGGLIGGHSGEDIHKGRGNANKLLVRFLYNEMHQTDLRIAKIDGGNLRNAIAREASATILVPMSFKEQLRIDLNHYIAEVENELKGVENDLRIDLSSASKNSSPKIGWKSQSVFGSEKGRLAGSQADRDSGQRPEGYNVLPHSMASRLIQSLYACPHGVYAMSRDIIGLVQTSTNLASIKMREDEQGKFIEVNTSQRSSIESEKHSLKEIVACALRLGGAEIEHTEGYPGWQPNPSSELLKIAVKAWQENEGKDPQVVAIHAGLECGLFLEKYPSLDMISFGPWMTGVHSPAEKLNIESTHRTYRWLRHTLELL